MLAHAHPELKNAKYVVFVDGNRRYVDCSDAVQELLGYQPVRQREKMEQALAALQKHAEGSPDERSHMNDALTMLNALRKASR